DEQGGPGQGPAALRLGRLRPRDRRIPRRLRVPWRRSDLQGLYGIRCRAQGRSAFGRGSAKVLRLLERGARRRRVSETPGSLSQTTSVLAEVPENDGVVGIGDCAVYR